MATVLHHLVTSDGWAFATGLFAMLGTFAAAYAILQAGRARAAATELLREERRREFRIDAALTLLDDLPDRWAHSGVQERLRMFSGAELPITRWLARIDLEWPTNSGPEPAPRSEWGVSDRTKYQQVDEQGNAVNVVALVGTELREFVARLVDEQVES